jgi:hypothetical protein
MCRELPPAAGRPSGEPPDSDYVSALSPRGVIRVTGYSGRPAESGQRFLLRKLDQAHRHLLATTGMGVPSRQEA